MNIKSLDFMSKRTIKTMLASIMVMIMFFSQITVAFADVSLPGTGINFAYSISYNGGPSVGDASSQLDSSKLTADYQSVPVDITFTLTFNNGKVKLSAGSWDPETGGFSTVTDRDLIQIQDADGNVVKDVTVSNAIDTGDASDTTAKVHPNTPLKPDTNYKLVVKKYFTKVNAQNQIKDVTKSDVIIPFKTASLQNPTLTKAELRGNTLTLEGLPKNQKLEYNLAVDGNFDDKSWTTLTYSDDTANISLSNVNLTSNSKIKVGYAKDDNSTPDNLSDPISVFYASSTGPSFTGTVLNGNNLVLNGLPKNSANLEYRIAADGQNYSDWKDLSYTDTSATVSAEMINLVGGQSIIQIRYKASSPWAASDISQNTFAYGLGEAAPLTQGKETDIDEGVKIASVSLNSPIGNETNTVTVRNAKGEKLVAPAGMTSNGFVEGNDDYVKSAGGVYGFSIKGSGAGDNNHVKITIPYQLPTTRPDDIPFYSTIDDSKVAIFVLTPFRIGGRTDLWQWWKMMPTTVDTVNHTATVDITGFDSNGEDIILGAKYYVYPPSNFIINPYSRTATSITFDINNGGGWCGIKEMVIQRINRADPSDKKLVTISYKDYPNLLNPYLNSWIKYTDNDPKPGVNYDYNILSAIDMLGNKSCAFDSATGNVVDNPSFPCYATLDSMDTLVKETQEGIYANLKQLQNTPYYQPHIMFASGDNQNNVTQKITLPTKGILNYGSNTITWKSDRPDIIKVGKNGETEVHPPIDKDGNPIKDGVTVTLTGTINYTSSIDGVTNQVESATGEVSIPLTVKWNITNGEVIIGNEFLHNKNMVFDQFLNTDPTIDINTIANFDNTIAKTIVLQHSIELKDKTVPIDISYTSAPQDYTIDAQGKTIKADFNGALFQSMQNHSGSFILKNAVIDMNHKTGSVLSAQRFGTKIIFDNVKIINAENCEYGILLEASTALGGNEFIANNCSFSSFKIAAIAASTPTYGYITTILGKTYTIKYDPILVNINNCTFDGEGKPGYGIIDTFGKVSIKNSTFKGYKGNVNTGWNNTNDNYDFQYLDNNNIDGDGYSYFQYKGIPDNSPSAAVLVKEQGSVDLSSNTITDSDNSIITWTGEKNFSFLWKKPAVDYVTYPTVNGIKVDSTTAEQVMNNLLSTNTITGINGSNKIVIQDASDRYKLTTILQKVNILSTNSTVNTSGSDNIASTTSIVAGINANEVYSTSVTTGSSSITIWILSAIGSLLIIGMSVIISANKKKKYKSIE